MCDQDAFKICYVEEDGYGDRHLEQTLRVRILDLQPPNIILLRVLSIGFVLYPPSRPSQNV